MLLTLTADGTAGILRFKSLPRHPVMKVNSSLTSIFCCSYQHHATEATRQLGSKRTAETAEVLINTTSSNTNTNTSQHRLSQTIQHTAPVVGTKYQQTTTFVNAFLTKLYLLLVLKQYSQLARKKCSACKTNLSAMLFIKYHFGLSPQNASCIRAVNTTPTILKIFLVLVLLD